MKSKSESAPTVKTVNSKLLLSSKGSSLIRSELRNGSQLESFLQDQIQAYLNKKRKVKE